MNAHSKRIDLALSAGICCVFLLLVNAFIPVDFSVNDDTTMVSILNGSYTGVPNPHAVFIGYPLSWLVSRFYATGVSISWYKWALLGSCGFGLASVLYRLYRRFPRNRLLATLGLFGLFLPLWLYHLVHTTYTVCGALLMGCSILSYAIQPADEDVKPGYLINLIAQAVLAFQLRDYFGYLTVPFLGVIWLEKHWGELRRNRAVWLVPLAGLMAFAVALGIDHVAYSGEWAYYKEYNDARSYLQDYHNYPDYSTHQEFINSLGLDKAEYKALRRYDYCLLEDHTPEVTIALSEYAKSIQPHIPMTTRVKTAVEDMVDAYLNFDLNPLIVASFLSPSLLLLCAVGCSWQDRKCYLVTPFLLLCGIGASWLLIAYEGRMPTRVLLSLRMLTISASLAGLVLLFTRRKLVPLSEKTAKRLTLVLCAVSVMMIAWGAKSTWERQQDLSVYSGDLYQYAASHPNELFVRETNSVVFNSDDCLLEFPRAPVNLLSSGGWAVYSPAYEEKLKTLGIDRVNRSLLLRDDVHLVLSLDDENLKRVLGISNKAVVEYEVEESFDEGLTMINIHSITLP